jgi:hypothetical protein
MTATSPVHGQPLRTSFESEYVRQGLMKSTDCAEVVIAPTSHTRAFLP